MLSTIHLAGPCERSFLNRQYLFCSVLKFGPVPTSPTPLLQGAPVRLLRPVGRASPQPVAWIVLLLPAWCCCGCAVIGMCGGCVRVGAGCAWLLVPPGLAWVPGPKPPFPSLPGLVLPSPLSKSAVLPVVPPPRHAFHRGRPHLQRPFAQYMPCVWPFLISQHGVALPFRPLRLGL